ncbi:hypothetical protein HWD35_22070 [Tsukamurella tyrosinosolvens]|uniref:Uncharacterized protein n=2 Tax=Tsukamurella TaxID=2060 RepID=A0A5C5RU69_9ACTN|nr:MULTISPECIES: hypothetical protein [Tsukamurella]KXP01233.1 hypothetical protein AXK59_23365 [Tsukamurella tyrosinosolvens]KZL94544.1 hypothetical protein AXX05_08870 [Tsukamurella tyrosinosolvens]MCA4997417.1 hypothetical protein [Tsukamurella tyrosinosolvens]NMD56996.1 hypothetical protein [Tsukamurella columbiensis]TWS25695.1 hypothetical protein FK530_22480 [Tsukamurella conjunctivitidis]
MSERRALPHLDRVRVEVRLESELAERLYDFASERRMRLSDAAARVIETGLNTIESEGARTE